MTENQMKEYLDGGGKFLKIKHIDTIRDGGTKIITLVKGGNFYIDKDTMLFHSSYPLTTENEVTNNLLELYLIERISKYTKELREDYERNQNFLTKLMTKRMGL